MGVVWYNVLMSKSKKQVLNVYIVPVGGRFSEEELLRLPKRLRKPPRKNAHIDIDNWETIRADILLRDGYSCRKCKGIDQLTVHHIDENRKNNDYQNLVTLCWPCHRKVHNRKIISPTND